MPLPGSNPRAALPPPVVTGFFFTNARAFSQDREISYGIATQPYTPGVGWYTSVQGEFYTPLSFKASRGARPRACAPMGLPASVQAGQPAGRAGSDCAALGGDVLRRPLLPVAPAPARLQAFPFDTQYLVVQVEFGENASEERPIQ